MAFEPQQLGRQERHIRLPAHNLHKSLPAHCGQKLFQLIAAPPVHPDDRIAQRDALGVKGQQRNRLRADRNCPDSRQSIRPRFHPQLAEYFHRAVPPLQGVLFRHAPARANQPVSSGGGRNPLPLSRGENRLYIGGSNIHPQQIAASHRIPPFHAHRRPLRAPVYGYFLLYQIFLLSPVRNLPHPCGNILK